MKNDLPSNHLPLTHLGAVPLARMIARGEVSASEALEQHIARAVHIQPRLNAMVAERFDAARAEARAADARQAHGESLGPLHGVPISIKDSLDLEGLPSTFGFRSRAGLPATADEPHVARLRAAGAIPFAKGNVAQGLLYYESDNPLHGRTLNPWNPERTPGGSSGGDAVLVATGASALALGTDIGGSLRVPAAFTGIVGFKPTAGRCDDPGRFSVPVGQQAIASQVGPLARRVEDAALALEILNGGPHPQPPAQPLGDWRPVDVARLRVACVEGDGTFAPAPAAVRAVREAAAMLADAGASVSPWTPPDADEALALFYGILGADGLQSLKRRVGGDPRHPSLSQLMVLGSLPRALVAGLLPLLRAIGQGTLARDLAPFGYRDAAHYFDQVEALLAYRARFAQALDAAAGGPFDLILCPPVALPALPHGASRDLGTIGAGACLFNVLGYPAGVVPVTRVRAQEQGGRAASRDLVDRAARRAEQGSAGLPVGVQVVARPWQDHLALAAMAAIEARAEPIGLPPLP